MKALPATLLTHLSLVLGLVLLSASGALAWPILEQPSSPPARPDSTARPDTTVRLSSVVVTATRTAKEIEDVAVPIAVVSAEEIERQGAVRLGEVLAAVPGLHFFDDHGTGIQVQGFAPDYTLILIDGQPVIGRTAGTLDLDRLTVQGVERVELVRGPSSSLYGSEALAGVVNIITSRPQDGLRGGLNVRGGSFATSDLSADVQYGAARGGARLLVNRYASDGYDLTPDDGTAATFGPTVPTFTDWTGDFRSHYDLTDRLELRLGARAAYQDQAGAFAQTATDGSLVTFDDTANRLDWSVHPEARLRLSDRIRLTSTLYAAGYQTETRFRRQDDGSLFYSDDFDQRLTRGEVIADALWNGAHQSIVGAGYTDERLVGDRYNFEGEQPVAQQAFAFAQHEWRPSRLVEVNASARLDAHSDYATQLSPKVAVLVRPSETIRLRASVGSGFKAPAFRQLYLAFTNAAAGYSVFGSTRLADGLAQLEADGLIAQQFLDPTGLDPIGSETSVAYNLGATVSPTPWLSTSLNLFYNDVTDLIETQPVAQKTNGQQVFGYFNLDRIYTRGVEAEATVLPLDALSLADSDHRVEVAVGYQFLQARDRDVIDALESGTVFGRDLNNRDVQLGVGDYAGLFGRSPHS
ncbi:MAG: TonB-dependent receptor, partial [Bacteroidota bacterium]